MNKKCIARRQIECTERVHTCVWGELSRPPPASGFARFLRLGSGRRTGGPLRIALFTRQMWQFFGLPILRASWLCLHFLVPRDDVYMCYTVCTVETATETRRRVKSKKILNTLERQVKYESVNTVEQVFVQLWSRLKLFKYRSVMRPDFEKNILQIYVTLL